MSKNAEIKPKINAKSYFFFLIERESIFRVDTFSPLFLKFQIVN